MIQSDISARANLKGQGIISANEVEKRLICNPSFFSEVGFRSHRLVSLLASWSG